MLESLEVDGFRNLQFADWAPAAGANLLLGPNGAGKTSTLEAIYLLATSRSFRASQLAECCRHGERAFAVRGRVEGDQRVDLAVEWSPEGKQRRLNGKSGPLTSHLAALPVVAWSAADRELIDGAPWVRRRFLDQGVVGLRPLTLEVLARFRRSLDGKRRLLLEGGPDLDAWDEVLAGAAVELMRLRRSYGHDLGIELQSVIESGNLELPGVELRYRPSVELEEDEAESMLRALASVRRRELQQRRPLIGPHRDDLELLWGGRPVRSVASAGEKKLLGLALCVARGRLLTAAGRSPIFLLDDLDSEFDAGRLKRVWAFFSDARQVFASSSRPAVWGDAEGTVKWRLERGGPLAG